MKTQITTPLQFKDSQAPDPVIIQINLTAPFKDPHAPVLITTQIATALHVKFLQAPALLISLTHMSKPVGPEAAPVAKCLFADDPINLFRKENFRIEPNITGSDNCLLPTIVVLDTGVGPNKVSEDWIPEAWTSAVIRTYIPRLRATGNEPIAVCKVIPSQFQLSDLSVRVWLGIVKVLTVNFLMGTSFLDRSIANISPMRQVFDPIRSVRVPINKVTSEEGASLRNSLLAHSRLLQKTPQGMHQPMSPPTQ